MQHAPVYNSIIPYINNNASDILHYFYINLNQCNILPRSKNGSAIENEYGYGYENRNENGYENEYENEYGNENE